MRTRIVPSMPALVLEGRRRCLVVSDTHVGFESGLASNEVFTGKNSTTPQAVSEISRMVRSERPDCIILLGDVKSSIGPITRQEWDDVPYFLSELQRQCDVALVPGNHDANIQRLAPSEVSLASSSGMVEEDILLTHGHAMPSENFAHVDKIVMGHVHPVFLQEGSVLNGQRVWVSLRAQKQDIFPGRDGTVEITILPSFNRYFYAERKKSRRTSMSPILDRIKGAVSARVITLDGVIIGDESCLKYVL